MADERAKKRRKLALTPDNVNYSRSHVVSGVKKSAAAESQMEGLSFKSPVGSGIQQGQPSELRLTRAILGLNLARSILSSFSLTMRWIGPRFHSNQGRPP